MAEVKKCRKSNFTPEEVDMLVNTVRKHYRTLYGKYAKRATNRVTRQRAWLDILKKVNRVSVEKRTIQEVKNKWKKCQYALKEQHGIGPDFEKDSMPLLQRLNTSPPQHQQQHENKHLLLPPAAAAAVAAAAASASSSATSHISAAAALMKSQSLSPTKLKVTRQNMLMKQQLPPAELSSKPVIFEPPPRPKSPVNEEMCLRWNSHHSNMQTAFPNILVKEQYVDVTLASEGKTLKCHRLILSSCSPYFEEILNGISPQQHPVLFMKDIPFWILKSLCDFMYAGEVHVFQNKLQELLSVAELLRIKGLAGKTGSGNNNSSKNNEQSQQTHHQQQQQQQQSKQNYHHAQNNSSNNNNNTNSGIDFDNDDMIDPLDLLEPMYEESAEDIKPITTPNGNGIGGGFGHGSGRMRDMKFAQQSLKKKIKKRKYSQEHEPSPPPVFHFRKGTRSRPNVKIPKYYDTDYNINNKSQNNNGNSSNNNNSNSKSLSSTATTTTTTTSTPQSSSQMLTFEPLIEIDDIKAEPIDVEENDVVCDYSDNDDVADNDNNQHGDDDDLDDLDDDLDNNSFADGAKTSVINPVRFERSSSDVPSPSAASSSSSSQFKKIKLGVPMIQRPSSDGDLIHDKSGAIDIMIIEPSSVIVRENAQAEVMENCSNSNRVILTNDDDDDDDENGVVDDETMEISSEVCPDGTLPATTVIDGVDGGDMVRDLCLTDLNNDLENDDSGGGGGIVTNLNDCDDDDNDNDVVPLDTNTTMPSSQLQLPVE